ncbi:hypothetical protein ACFW9F_23920, partial [Streptomyces sp. NPDC059506]
MNLTRWSARLPGTQRRGSAGSRRADASSQPVPAARGDRADRTDGTGGTDPSAPPGPADPPEPPGPSPALSSRGADVHGIHGSLPARIAVTHGPEHRLAYVNDAYAQLLGR